MFQKQNLETNDVRLANKKMEPLSDSCKCLYVVDLTQLNDHFDVSLLKCLNRKWCRDGIRLAERKHIVCGLFL